MINEELKTFISKMRAAGKSDEEIVQSLKSGGWSEKDALSAAVDRGNVFLAPQGIQDISIMEQIRWYDKWWGMVLIIMLSMVPAILFVRDIKNFTFVFAIFFFLGIVPVFILIFPIAKLIEKLVFADRRRFPNRNLLAIAFLSIGIISAFIGVNGLIHPIPDGDIGGVVVPIILVLAGISSLLIFLMLLMMPLVWNIILKISQKK